MEPPKGFLASLWNFICFLPYFIALLLLGTIKGTILCPLICLIMTIGNSAIILGLWPLHVVWTYYSILRAKQLGMMLKLVLSICLPVVLILCPVVVIIGSIIGGALYGFLSPILATFGAVGEGKNDQFFHCFFDGTRSSIEGSFTVVRDFGDVCYHSYFSIMDDLRKQEPKDGKYLDIRLLYLFGVVVVSTLGIVVDLPMISLIALYKGPYMLFKGWHRLFHDLIGREGPFLETICVPFAGLAILLWPLAVTGAILASVLSSIFLGAYAGVVVYQEFSIWFGVSYIVASLAIYDEYSNDILDMPEGSCFPRPQYRRRGELSRMTSHTSSILKPGSFKNPVSRSGSLKSPIIEFKPLELLDNLFKECQCHGEIFVSQGLITPKDIADVKSGSGSQVIAIGLPAYCLLQALLRSVKANSAGILLSDNVTEITSTNRAKETIYDWFINPFLIIKEQIKAENLCAEEEDYLCKLVLLSGEPERLENSTIPKAERRRAELDALARRLRGMTKSVSRYPTFKRHIDSLVKTLSENLASKNGDSNVPQRIRRSKSAFARIFSQRSFKNRNDQDSRHVDVEID